MKIKWLIALTVCLCFAFFAFGCADNSTDGGDVSDTHESESVSDTVVDNNGEDESASDTDDGKEEDSKDGGIEGSGVVDDRPVADLGELPHVPLS